MTWHEDGASINCQNRLPAPGLQAVHSHLGSSGFSRTMERTVSDRKYRQRGYQDSPRERRPAQSGPGAPQPPRPPADRIETRADKAERKALEGRAPSVPGFHEVMRCSRCANVFTGAIAADSRCKRCGADLRSCAQCESFDAGQAVRMRADHPRADRSEGCAKRVRAVFAARHGRARHALAGAASGPKQRAQGVR